MQFSIAIVFSTILVVVSSQTYRAGVAMVKPFDDPDETSDQRIRSNAAYIASFLKSNKDKADIFVLPGYGITNIEDDMSSTYLLTHSTTIGNVSDNVCAGKNDQNPQLVSIACAANESNAYVVANFIESIDEKNFSLTTVGFDKSGILILKCRQVHIMNGTGFITPTDQNPCTFTATINKNIVKFTVLFGTDLVYPMPEAIKSENVIVTTAIRNRLPLEFGLSLFQGFAASNGVNLIVSGFSDLTRSYGGSGIFYSNGSSVIAFDPVSVPGGKVNESMLIRTVPVKPELSSVINVNAVNVGPTPNGKLAFRNITTLTETNKELTKCVEKRCCNFRVDAGGNSIAPYKWVALLNATMLDQNTSSLFCALVLPSADATPLNLKNISITTNIDKSEVLLSLPIGLNDKWVPASFVYNRDSHSVSLSSDDKVVVLGLLEVLGGTPSPSGGGGNTALIVVIVLLILVLVGLLVAFFVWRNRQAKNRRNF